MPRNGTHLPSEREGVIRERTRSGVRSTHPYVTVGRSSGWCRRDTFFLPSCFMGTLLWHRKLCPYIRKNKLSSIFSFYMFSLFVREKCLLERGLVRRVDIVIEMFIQNLFFQGKSQFLPERIKRDIYTLIDTFYFYGKGCGNTFH